MVETAAPIFETRNLNVHYGDVQALKDICLPVAAREITALIGPSGCGKSTFLRGLNRYERHHHRLSDKRRCFVARQKHKRQGC